MQIVVMGMLVEAGEPLSWKKMGNFLNTSYPCQSSDWDLRYTDALKHLQVRAEERQPGLGSLTVDLHQMLLDGYTTSNFARKHHLNETQMNRLFAILREEATSPFSSAA